MPPQQWILKCKRQLILSICRVVASKDFAKMNEAATAQEIRIVSPADMWIQDYEGLIGDNQYHELNYMRIMSVKARLRDAFWALRNFVSNYFFSPIQC